MLETFIMNLQNIRKNSIGALTGVSFLEYSRRNGVTPFVREIDSSKKGFNKFS